MIGRSKGFTLVEMAVGLFLLAAVATLAYRILLNTQSTYRTHRDIVEATQNARIAMEAVSSDIRQISYGKDPTQASIVFAGADSIVFVADMYDSVPGGEIVSFYLTAELDSVTQNPSDRLIYRSVADTGGTILEEGPVAYGVADSGLTFLYFDRDGAQMSFPIVQPEHVSEVEVAVTAQTAHYEKTVGYRDVTVTSIVYPRNLPFSPPMARPSSPVCQSLVSPNCGSLTAAWSTPTTNTDGSELKFNDISFFAVYYGTKLDSMKMDTRLARNVNEWTVGNLTAGETYYISVTVTSQAGVESFSCTQQGAVGTTAPPSAPAPFSGVGGAGGVSLSWTPVTTDSAGSIITAAVTYSVYRGATSGFTVDASTQIATGVADTSYYDPVVDSCGTYYYRVTAQACGLDGAPSSEIGVSTTPPPSCPSSITAVEGTTSGEITVSWNPPSTRVDGSPISTADLSWFIVRYSLTSGIYTDSLFVGGGSATSANLTGLLFCETYYTNVSAVDLCSNEGTLCVGLEAAARTKAPCNAMVPQEPTNLYVVGGSARVDITWKPNTFDCDLDGYRIYYGTSPGDLWGSGAVEGPSPVYVDAGAVQIDTSSAAFSLTGLMPCVVYYITITSVDNCSPANESVFPPEVSAMVDCSPCNVAKECVYEEAVGSFQEQVNFTVGNEGGSDITVEQIELKWGSGSNVTEVRVEGSPVWSAGGASGDGPAGAQGTGVVLDVWDFDLFATEDFTDPVEMTVVFDGSANGDVIDVVFHTNDGVCTVTLSPCATLFSDNFTEPDGAVAGWTPRTGTWDISGNTLHTSKNARITPDPFGFGNTDFTAEAKVLVVGSKSNRRAGIYVRYIDTGNYYLFRFYPATSLLEFRKKVSSGSLVKLASTYAYNVAGDVWRTMKVSAYGNTFRCWVDDQLIDWGGSTGTVITDSSIPAGSFSFYAWREADAWFDDVTISPTCGCGGVVP